MLRVDPEHPPTSSATIRAAVNSLRSGSASSSAAIRWMAGPSSYSDLPGPRGASSAAARARRLSPVAANAWRRCSASCSRSRLVQLARGSRISLPHRAAASSDAAVACCLRLVPPLIPPPAGVSSQERTMTPAVTCGAANPCRSKNKLSYVTIRHSPLTQGGGSAQDGTPLTFAIKPNQ